MKKLLLIFTLCLNNILLAETGVLPLIIRGRLISPEEKVIKTLSNQVKEINLTNTLQKEIIILGRTETKPFAYEIKKGMAKTYRIEAKEITELFYILDGKKYKLEKYSDIKK